MKARRKPHLKVCLLAPNTKICREVYVRVLKVLSRYSGLLEILLVGLLEFDLSESVDVKIFSGLGDRALKREKPDVFVCCDFPTITEALTAMPGQALVYGVTMDTLSHGALPAHPLIIGYFVVEPFLQGVLTVCGVPLERQFVLIPAVDIGADFDQKPKDAKSRGVLLCSEGRALTSMAMGACEILGLRLERLSSTLTTKSLATDFLRQYDCVIGSGQLALQAAAAGVPVVVADERGSAGLLTQDKLALVIAGHAGPTCFNQPLSMEAFLAALTDSRTLKAGEMAQDMRRLHGYKSRSREFVDWLRRISTHSLSAPEHGSSERRPYLLNIPAMIDAAWFSCIAQKSPSQNVDSVQVSPIESCQVLVDPVKFTESDAMVVLPLERYIDARSGGDAPAGLFREGWANGEAWGRWSDGHVAAIQFQAGRLESDLELVVHIHTYLPPGRLFQRVGVSVNGRPCVCWKLDRHTSEGPFRVPLSLSDVGDAGVFRIEFHLPDAEAPVSWGQIESRKLGIGLAGMSLWAVNPRS